MIYNFSVWLLTQLLDSTGTLTTTQSHHRSVQEMWEHAKAFGWDFTSIYSHVFRLADTLCSSKEVCEDLLGRASDLKRSNKNPFKAGGMERFHFQNSYWVRLPKEQWDMVTVHRNDVVAVQHQPRRTHVNLGTSARNGAVLKTFRAAVLKKKKGYLAFILFGVFVNVKLLLVSETLTNIFFSQDLFVYSQV